MFTSDRELESYQRARDYIIIVFHDRWYHYRCRYLSLLYKHCGDRKKSFESAPVLKLIFISIHANILKSNLVE